MLNTANEQGHQDLEVEVIDENEIIIENEYEDDSSSTEKSVGTSTAQNEERESRFKDGEPISLVRVRFPGNAKSFPFLVGKKKFSYGQKVVAMSDRGMTVGYINSFPYEVKYQKSMGVLRSIAKLASDEDIQAQMDFRAAEKKAEVLCLKLIDKYKLEMVLTHVEFIQFGKKAVFYFNAPERVDFRDLVKDLVADLKMRIELRQISVRDRAAALGAIGACGLQTCCSSFLKNYGSVSIKMAKNQNLALIPSKLNGVCGQIKCCIKYEDEVYTEKRRNLPEEQTIVKVLNGDIGKVLRLHLLVEQFELLTDRGVKRRYAQNQFSEDIKLPENYRFPESFEHITDETREIIGLPKEKIFYSDAPISQHANEDEFLENKAMKELEEISGQVEKGSRENTRENNRENSRNNNREQRKPEQRSASGPRQNQNQNNNQNRNQRFDRNDRQRSPQNGQNQQNHRNQRPPSGKK